MDRIRALRIFLPPPAVALLLAVEVVAAGIALALGVAAWPTVLAVGTALLVGFTLAVLSPTLQELAGRRPKLALMSDDGARPSAPRRPWPIDIDRIVANEVADARQTTRWRNRPLEGFMPGAALSLPASDAEHEEASARFEERVTGFEQELGGWLANYRVAARRHADTFALALRLEDGPSGAFAEDVVVVLEVPPGVRVVDALPEMTTPPERPSYEPPPRHPLRAFGRIDPGLIALSPDRHLDRAAPRPLERRRLWRRSEDGRRLETSVGDLHPGRTLAIGEAVLLQTPGPGTYGVRWSAFSKSARRPARGTLDLEVPADPSRPAFGRLAGPLRYPDVRLVDEEGETHEVRGEDPPGRPERTEGGDVVDRLRDAHALMAWKGLGLDPGDDGPEEGLVEDEPDRRSA